MRVCESSGIRCIIIFLEDSQIFSQAWGTNAASSRMGESLVVELFLAARSATIVTREVQRGLIETFVFL